MERTPDYYEIKKQISSAGEHLINIAVYHISIIALSILNLGLYLFSESIDDYIVQKVIIGLIIIFCIIMTIAELLKAGKELADLSQRNDKNEELINFAKQMEKDKKEFEEKMKIK